MKRRRPTLPEPPPPPHLATFDPDDWPPPDPAYWPDGADWRRMRQRLQWNRARSRWRTEHRRLS